MGDIIKKFEVRSTTKEKARRLRLYFDSGSPRTFIKLSPASRMHSIAELAEPRSFQGLGNGRFQATHVADIEVKLLGIWVPHLCYVVPDELLDPDYDILLGHDFMQIYDIRLQPRQKNILVRKEALKMALKVRSLGKE